MYKIGYAWRPGTLDDNDYWSLDIDYVQEERDVLQDHDGIMQIHGETLSACLLRAKFICLTLNDDPFHAVEIFAQLMELAKVIHVEREEYLDDAESNS